MDPHQPLGLTPDATEKEIRKAYHRLAMQNHPDRHPDDPKAGEKFKQVQWSYETLTGTKRKDSVPNRPAQYQRPFSEDAHLFFGFFCAMRNHYAKKRGPTKHG